MFINFLFQRKRRVPKVSTPEEEQSDAEEVEVDEQVAGPSDRQEKKKKKASGSRSVLQNKCSDQKSSLWVKCVTCSRAESWRTTLIQDLRSKWKEAKKGGNGGLEGSEDR